LNIDLCRLLLDLGPGRARHDTPYQGRSCHRRKGSGFTRLPQTMHGLGRARADDISLDRLLDGQRGNARYYRYGGFRPAG
jgi:hypothetical protein